jgi:hypothetical protein
MLRPLAALAAGALAIGGLAAPADAQDVMERVEVHGYGGWGYGRTTANDSPNFFNFAHQRGDYSHSEFALNVAVPVNDQLTVVAQPFWHAGHHANQTESGIDFAFAEWKFSDLTRFRAGLVKQPFGIYTEVFDVGTLRPFATLPSSIYGPAGTIGKAYSGIGLTGALYSTRGWGVLYDAYVGGLEVPEWDVGLQVASEGADTVGKSLSMALSKTLRDVAGGRLTVHTPNDALHVGLSSYTGTRPAVGAEVRRTVVGTHAELLVQRLTLRGEATRTRESDRMQRRMRAAYAEASYRATEHWQVAATASAQRTELAGVAAANVSRAPSLLKHDEAGAGLNYWFSPNFVLKSSYHRVRGNRFAAPEQPRIRAAVANGLLEPNTNVVLFGAQMSF